MTGTFAQRCCDDLPGAEVPRHDVLVVKRIQKSTRDGALDIYAPFRDVIILVCAHQTPDFLAAPGSALTRFLDDNDEEVRVILQEAEFAADLPVGLLWMFDEEGLPNGEQGEEFFRGWLARCTRCRAPFDIDFSDEPVLSTLLAHGIECQLVGLIGGLVSALLNRPQLTDRHLVAAVSTATRTARLTGHAEPEALVLSCYMAWCLGPLGSILMPRSGATDEARSTLRSITFGLDRMLGRGNWLQET